MLVVAQVIYNLIVNLSVSQITLVKQVNTIRREVNYLLVKWANILSLCSQIEFDLCKLAKKR